MNLLTGDNPRILWRDAVKQAESRCSVSLTDQLESYLISLLMQYADKPGIVKQIFATAFLDALQKQIQERQTALRNVGDQCLLFAGLFPKAAERKQVKIDYFVDLGRSAYAAISQTTNDLYSSLAMQFVVMMDVLQCVRHDASLLPLEAYEQWRLVGSERALQYLRAYSEAGIYPIKKLS